MGLVYSKAYRMISSNLGIDIEQARLLRGYSNKKQYLLAHHPNELYYFLTVASK